jgi:midasin (ATPase involved in ribosome maturation)
MNISNFNDTDTWNNHIYLVMNNNQTLRRVRLSFPEIKLAVRQYYDNDKTNKKYNIELLSITGQIIKYINLNINILDTSPEILKKKLQNWITFA